jgi:hypothetical protein
MADTRLDYHDILSVLRQRYGGSGEPAGEGGIEPMEYVELQYGEERGQYEKK